MWKSIIPASVVATALLVPNAFATPTTWNFYETSATPVTGTTYLVPISVEEILTMPDSGTINYAYNGGGGCNAVSAGWSVIFDLKNSLSAEAETCNYQATVDLTVVNDELNGTLTEITDDTDMSMTIIDDSVTDAFVSTTGNEFGISDGYGYFSGYWQDPDLDAPGRIPAPEPGALSLLAAGALCLIGARLQFPRHTG